MEIVKYCALIPAENPVRQGCPLNLLLVAENTSDRDMTHKVRLYGNDGNGWRELLAEDRELLAHDHTHLYFQIPADRFAASFWEGEAPEELEILAANQHPKPEEQGLLLFLT